MSNYCATARSNYFAVKDEAAFRQWAERLELKILIPTGTPNPNDGVPRFGITPGDDIDFGGWPVFCRIGDSGENEDIDIHEELSAHLADGEVAVLMEIGNEKLRYVTGTAIAINNKGESVRVDLEAIYAAAAHLGKTITPAEY